ncbi:hypothetical protein SAMN02787142_5482 [Burkholderia sp. WP9]|uniref:hypothetical protein n=1 Tax=Burkholderia sp. WP9 TaxID=1500263 RepID=UPI00089D80CD|nr:hypothetical protein [Burkholderia sp. WP9]SEE92232.1 hypothetical protein SAMN02787142_5482 [Burkholderia sp. WP9]
MESQNRESSMPAIGDISALALNHFFAQRAMRAFWAHFDEALRHTEVTEGRKAVASAMIPWMRAYEDTFAFVRLIDLDSMRDLFHAIRDMKRLDDLNDASGVSARPESRLLLCNDAWPSVVSAR